MAVASTTITRPRLTMLQTVEVSSHQEHWGQESSSYFHNLSDTMKMDEDTFAVYAAQLEQEEFECLLYKLCNTLKQLVDA